MTAISLFTLPLGAKSLGYRAPGWLGMGPSNCVKPIGNISLQESTEVSLNAVNWGMKAHQQAAVLRSDQRVAYMSQRGV